jgi:hypothetical protein
VTTEDGAGPPPRPTPLLLTGRIDEIDPASRFVRVGSHTIEIPPPVALDGIRVGERVIVKGVREPASGRILARELVRLRAPLGRTAGSAAQASDVRLLVGALLSELGHLPSAVDCELFREVDRYAIRLELPGAPDRTVLLSRSVLERALTDALARRTVRNVLQAAVTMLRVHRAAGDIRREVLQQRAWSRSWLGSRCARCEGPLSADDPILVEAGFRGHLACPPMW